MDNPNPVPLSLPVIIGKKIESLISSSIPGPLSTTEILQTVEFLSPSIWVVDDDESIRWVLDKGLSENGMDVQTFDSANKVIKKLETENPHLILTDIRMPGPSGIDLLDKVKELRPDIPSRRFKLF